MAQLRLPSDAERERTVLVAATLRRISQTNPLRRNDDVRQAARDAAHLLAPEGLPVWLPFREWPGVA